MKRHKIFECLAMLSIILPTIGNRLFDLLAYLAIAGCFSLNLKRLTAGRKDQKQQLTQCATGIIFSVIVTATILYATAIINEDIPEIKTWDDIKLGVQGILTIFILFGTVIYISKIEINEDDKLRFAINLVKCGGINSIINNTAWFIETKGEFDRYNYIPPLTESQGLEIYYMAVTIVIGVAILTVYKTISKSTRLIVLGAIATASFSCLTLQVREGWVIMLFAITCTWALLSKISTFKKITIAATALTSSFVILAISMQKLNLLDDIQFGMDRGIGDSSTIRFEMIENSLRTLKNNWITGIGYGNYSLFVPQAVYQSGGEEIIVTTPHNGVMLIAVEIGIVGLILHGLLCFSILYMSLKQYQKNNGPATKMLAAVIMAFIGPLILDQLISNSLLLPPPGERKTVQFSLLLWTIIGVALARNPLDSTACD